jgi:TM2 domain-containing membrane protein YozV
MKYHAYNLELLSVLNSVPEGNRDNFINRYAAQAKNPTVIFGYSIYLGFWGVDRFALGHTGLGILKLLTFGGLLVWHFIDLFLVGGIARTQNVELAREIASTCK